MKSWVDLIMFSASYQSKWKKRSSPCCQVDALSCTVYFYMSVLMFPRLWTMYCTCLKASHRSNCKLSVLKGLVPGHHLLLLKSWECAHNTGLFRIRTSRGRNLASKHTDFVYLETHRMLMSQNYRIILSEIFTTGGS